MAREGEAENPRYVYIVADAQPRPKESLWAKVQPALYNPWVVAIGSGLIVRSSSRSP
jgi:hypothetical protein